MNSNNSQNHNPQRNYGLDINYEDKSILFFKFHLNTKVPLYYGKGCM